MEAQYMYMRATLTWLYYDVGHFLLSNYLRHLLFSWLNGALLFSLHFMNNNNIVW